MNRSTCGALSNELGAVKQTGTPRVVGAHGHQVSVGGGGGAAVRRAHYGSILNVEHHAINLRGVVGSELDAARRVVHRQALICDICVGGNRWIRKKDVVDLGHGRMC